MDYNFIANQIMNKEFPAISKETYTPYLLLGEGASAGVFAATRQSDAKKVAMKILDPFIPDSDREIQEGRFRRERDELSKQLIHPHILTMYDGGDFYFPSFKFNLMYGIMDLAKRPDFSSSYIDKKVDATIDVLDALAFAHDQGIVHRDVKEDNVLITEEGKIVLADFGLGKGAESKTVTMAGTSMGTGEYISPEAALGEHGDGKSDVYSAGAMLYKLITGSPANGGDTTITRAVSAASPEEIKWLLQTCEDNGTKGKPTERLEHIVAMMLAKNINNRLTAANARDELTIARYLNETTDRSEHTKQPDGAYIKEMAYRIDDLRKILGRLGDQGLFTRRYKLKEIALTSEHLAVLYYGRGNELNQKIYSLKKAIKAYNTLSKTKDPEEKSLFASKAHALKRRLRIYDQTA